MRNENESEKALTTIYELMTIITELREDVETRDVQIQLLKVQLESQRDMNRTREQQISDLESRYT